MRDLSPKQQRFVDALLADPEMHIGRAAEAAGYKNPDVLGSRVRKLAHVAAAIDAAMKSRRERVEVKQDEVLRALLRLMNVDLRKAYDAEGRPLPVHQLPDDVALALAGVETFHEYVAGVPVGEVRKLKLGDRARAVDLAMKHLGLFKDTKVKHEGTIVVQFEDPYAQADDEGAAK